MATVHQYTRFSTLDQLQGDSLRRQSEDGLEWITKNKHKRSELVFQDLGKSSYRGNKQAALNRFLTAIDEGLVQPGDILLIEAVDRLSRKGIRETQDLCNQIFNAGIDIAILTPLEKVYLAANNNDIGGTIELAAFAYAAHIYSELLSGRIKKWWTGARKVAREQKKRIPGQSPGWVIKKDTGFELDPVAAETIRYIFERTVDGIGANQLCAELNRDFTKLGRKAFNKTFVRELIRSRIALGEFQPHVMTDDDKRVPDGDPIPDYYPAVIDEKTWLAAQQACDNRKIERGPSSDFCNLFVGLVHHVIDDCLCHIYTYQQRRADGRKVIFRRLKSYRAVCGEPGASSETFDLIEFENLILKTLVEVDATTFGKKSTVSELAAVRGELSRKEKRIAELKLKLESDDSVNFLIETIKKLLLEVSELKKKVQKLAAEDTGASAATIFERIKKLNEVRNDPENRQLLREAIKRVIKQINVMMRKTGPLRRSPIAILIEIVFHDSNKSRLIFACGKNSLQLDGAQFQLKGQPMPPLHEVPHRDIVKWWKDLAKSDDWLLPPASKKVLASNANETSAFDFENNVESSLDENLKPTKQRSFKLKPPDE